MCSNALCFNALPTERLSYTRLVGHLKREAAKHNKYNKLLTRQLAMCSNALCFNALATERPSYTTLVGHLKREAVTTTYKTY